MNSAKSTPELTSDRCQIGNLSRNTPIAKEAISEISDCVFDRKDAGFWTNAKGNNCRSDLTNGDDNACQLPTIKAATNLDSTTSKKCTVSFGVVEIRKYRTILGDHPDCSHGPPLSIGWKYSSAKTLSVDDYEDKRGSSRRTRYELRIPHIDRLLILRHVGYSIEEILRRVREVDYAKKRRSRSRSMTRLSKVKEVMHSTHRKLSRGVRGARSA